MSQNISKERRLAAGFLQDNVGMSASWVRTIHRADGTVERDVIAENVVTAEGLNQLATLGLTNGNSAFLYLAIGTVTAAHSLGSVVTQFGEVSRKTPVTIGTSKDLMIMVMTWAGGLNSSLTNIPLGSAAMVNHASSGNGVTLNLTNSINATLQNCDYLNLECRVRVGSHAI